MQIFTELLVFDPLTHLHLSPCPVSSSGGSVIPFLQIISLQQEWQQLLEARGGRGHLGIPLFLTQTFYPSPFLTHHHMFIISMVPGTAKLWNSWDSG